VSLTSTCQSLLAQKRQAIVVLDVDSAHGLRSLWVAGQYRRELCRKCSDCIRVSEDMIGEMPGVPSDHSRQRMYPSVGTAVHRFPRRVPVLLELRNELLRRIPSGVSAPSAFLPASALRSHVGRLPQSAARPASPPRFRSRHAIAISRVPDTRTAVASVRREEQTSLDEHERTRGVF
jgi:hypothetical protein